MSIFDNSPEASCCVDKNGSTKNLFHAYGSVPLEDQWNNVDTEKSGNSCEGKSKRGRDFPSIVRDTRYERMIWKEIFFPSVCVRCLDL